MGKSLRFEWRSAGPPGGPDPAEAPASFSDLRHDWEFGDEPAEPRGFRLSHLPALIFLVCVILAALDQGANWIERSDAVGAAASGAAKELRAIRTAQDGLSCLAGAGPCPGGRSSPFK